MARPGHGPCGGAPSACKTYCWASSPSTPQPTTRTRPCTASPRRVIVDDPPSLREAAEHQREQPRRLLVHHLQREAATHQRRVRPEHLDLEFGEGQFAHLLAFRLVPLLVALQRRVPAFG